MFQITRNVLEFLRRYSCTNVEQDYEKMHNNLRIFQNVSINLLNHNVTLSALKYAQFNLKNVKYNI